MSIRTKLFTITILLVMVLGLIAGCSPAETPVAETVAEEEVVAEEVVEEEVVAPAEKKVFTFGRYADAITPDPVMNDANADIWYLQQYYSGLIRFNPENEIEGDLAESWEISEDGMTYTFYLRPDLKFADGSPITAEDWVWSLERAANPENGIWSFTLEAAGSFTADDEKVTIVLQENYTPFIYSLALFNAVVMPKAQVEAAGGWEAFMEKPIGAGPFVMTEWKRGEYMSMVANEYYWDAENVTLDEIMVRTLPDDNTRILSLQAGEVDAINYPPFNRITDLSADANLAVLTFPSTYTTFITLNIRNAPLDDQNVRNALAHAIDRDAMLATINFGVGEPATTWRPRGSLYYNYDLEGWPYDVELAKSLMAEAGYADGFDLVLEIVTGREQHQQMSTLLKDMWAAIGVNLEIVPLESGLYSANYYDNSFEVHLNGWTDDVPDPSQSVNYAVVFATAESFHTGFQSDEIDQLAAEALTVPNGPEREAMYLRIQEIFNEATPMIPLYHEPYLVITRAGVSNFFQTPLGTYIWRGIEIK
jgi:peptide/nickel transport system substrate-binding protein